MNFRLVLNYVGKILRIEAVLMLPALVIALVKLERSSVIAFAVTIALCAAIGMLLAGIKPRDRALLAREGFVIVSLSWIIMSLFGALPFFLSGYIPNFIDSLFETVSGFTTTGASILTDVERLSMSLLYWRSFTHWVGGMGVLVFMLAVLPVSKGSGDVMRLIQAESPGPDIGKLVPTVRRTARRLYAIYIILTVVEIILLVCGGMPVFDSVVNSFGTAGTGGFGIKNASIGYYQSYYLQGVIGVFMLLFGINFNIYHLVLLRDFKSIFKNEELRLYLLVIAAATAAITFNTLGSYPSLYDAFHDSFFQVSSIITTTGFSTADFGQWPMLSRSILVLLMLLGACAGSTGGGIKMERSLMLLKSLKNELQRLIHPRSVRLIRVNDKPVESSTIRGVYSFISAYLIVCIISALLVSFDNQSFETTMTSVIACVNNIGPGLGAVGPVGNYSSLSPMSKIVLSLDMLFGRLEIFPMMLLFSPSVWKKAR